MDSSETVTRIARGAPLSWPRYWWLNVLCAIATLLSTTLFGYTLVTSFRNGSALDANQIWLGYTTLLHGDTGVWMGLEFSLPLLLILFAHELGHYLQCLYWKVDATLPYFLPSPLLFGTFGAFIKIKSPIFSRASLFDIGIAGPLAGFAVLIPFLTVGVAWSQPLSALPVSNFTFGTPLALRFLESIFFPGVPVDRILLHPMAMAAWMGLLATAMNLLPMGQLDGGHIIYATLGPRLHRIVSTVFVAILAITGFWYHAWWIWAFVFFFVGRRHPLVYDRSPLPIKRWLLVPIIGLVFLLSFSVVPIRVG